MAINLSEINKAFSDNRTQEEKAEQEAIEQEWDAYDKEQNDWETHAYNSNLSGEEFRAKREEIRTKYLGREIIKPAKLP